MPIAAALGFLSANPGLIMAIPGAITGLFDIIQSVQQSGLTPADKKAELDRLLVELRAEVEAVKNTPLPPRR